MLDCLSELGRNVAKVGLPLAALQAGCGLDYQGVIVKETTVVEEGDTIIVDDTCPVDENTGPMMYSWNKAHDEAMACLEDSAREFEACLDADDDGVNCFDQANLSDNWCYYWEAMKVNKEPLRICGTTVFDLNGDPSQTDFGWEVNMEDADGDGVANWWEYLMGYNPCAEVSYYSGECTTDGEADYDGDGLSNAEDEQPYCYGDMGQGDPADYGSDCV